MATSTYFNNFPVNQNTSEQSLIEDLLIESIKHRGMDVYYMPRSTRNEFTGVDSLFGEDVNKQFTEAYPIETYLENVSGMDGEGDFISKFGLEIRDELTILVSRRRFKQIIPEMIRPREGDIIYIPLVQNFFEITFVEHESDQAMFYTLGRGRSSNVFVYAIKLKQYAFSEEIIKTGITEVDEQAIESYKKTMITLSSSGSGKFIIGETVYQGTDLANSTCQAIVSFYKPNTHIEIIQVRGYFSNNDPIIGVTSGAIKYPSNVDEEYQVGDNIFEDLADNKIIKEESSDIIDFSETNPFSES